MKKLLTFLICLTLLTIGCKKSQDNGAETKSEKQSETVTAPKGAQDIIALYKEVDSLTQHGSMNREKMQQFVNEAVDFAKQNPQDTVSPHFMLYAGITQMQIAFSNANENQRVEQAQEAINILEKLRQNYPDYRNAIYAYYYKAQIYENLGETEAAEKTYRDLVERFPDTPLGKQIAEYIKAGGYEKSAEEIYQNFQQKR